MSETVQETVQETDYSRFKKMIDTVLLIFMNAFAHRSGYGQSVVDVGVQLYRDAPLHSFQNPTEFCEWFTEERLRCNEIIRRLPNVHTTDHEEFVRLDNRRFCAKYFSREMEYQCLFAEPIILLQ
jgi:hypothetical protein